MVPWEEGPSAFLGKYSNRPPSLIIQDELHLISGPLGSVVGHYEDLLFEIMKKYGQPPKIIASTATIRRAKEQVNCLYNRPVQAFPPQALNYDDSFFAVEAAKRGGEQTETPVADGRRYVGVYGGALKSTLTAQRNLVAACLQFVNLFGRSLLKKN